MKGNCITIPNLRAQLARAEGKRREEEGRRRVEENRRREEEEKRQAAKASLDALTSRTTLEEYLKLLQKYHAARIKNDLDCPRNTKSGVTNRA
jgi:hypothetical protein